MKTTLIRKSINDITYLLFISLLVRILFIIFFPKDAISVDLLAWNQVAHELSLGNNPYHTTALLNWPPIWIQIIFCLSKISGIVNIPLTHAIQFFDITIESLSLIVTYFSICHYYPQALAKKILLFGVSLNPISVFQVCQHGNFDVLVGLWVVLLVYYILSYLRDANSLDWMLACMFLGLGIVTKTTPIMLLPLCLLRSNCLHWKVKLIGAVLIILPVSIGMGVIYTLTPEDVAIKVLSYRSGAGWFGITGILRLIPNWGQILMLFYVKFSSFGILAFLAYMIRYSLKQDTISQLQAIWLSILPFISVVTFGPGYAPQYIEWFMPLLLLVYAAEDKKTKTSFELILWIAIATYTIEYAFFPSHGSFLLKNNPSQVMQTLAISLSSQTGQTLIRLPIFCCYVFLFQRGWRRLQS